MNLQKIIIIISIIFVPLFFILYGTYFNINIKNHDFLNQKLLSNMNIGFQEINNYSTGISFSEIQKEIKFNDNKIYVDNFDYINKVYFSSKNYLKKDINGIKTFLIGSGGLYIFDLYNLTNQLNIDGTYFKINPKSPGRFFIDNRDNQNIKIFSFDSIFDISLIDSGKEMTNISIYPKMYFGFNVSKNKFLKNADLFRIETISKIFYISKDILGINNKINNDFLKQTYFIYDKKAYKFLNVSLKELYSKNRVNKYDESKIVLIKDIKLNGLDYIDKYYLLFLNKEKKAIYYKKNVLNNLNNLFKKNGVFDKNNVLSSLNELKKIDENDFHEFKKIVYYYYDNLLKINSIEYIDKIFIFSEIISNIEGTNTIYSIKKSSFFLNKLYYLVNNKIYDNNYLQTNFLEFLEYYLHENKINITGNFNVNIENKNILLRMDYLSFFIKNILFYNLNLSDSKNHENILNIFKLYINIISDINNLKNYEKSETLIIENNYLIEKILFEIRKNFFEKELNNDGLLILSKENEISSKNISLLNEIMNMFFNFFTSKKGFLSEKNQIYNDIYTKNITEYNHYYDALNNYPEYLIKYNKASSDLLDTKTIFEESTIIKLSKENLITYLNNFDGIDLSNILFEIVNNNYYKIDNLNINGETFSFNLYPQEFNRIANIIKNGQKLKISYELDNIKLDWDKKYEKADQEEKDKYDFKKFFINIFFKNYENKKEDFILDEKLTETEDKIISIFKRDKLLGDKGEFSLLKDYLELKYNNIKVTYTNGIYDIKLENIILKTRVDINGELVEIIGLLNADYVFNENDHYFKNINFKFYDINEYKNGTLKFLFDGKTFIINKNINIFDFKNEMDSILSKYFLNG